MVLKSKCKTHCHSQVQLFTKRIHKIQHVMVPIAKIYYAERIQSRIDKSKKRAFSEVQRKPAQASKSLQCSHKGCA